MANIGPKGILRHIDDPSVTVIGDDASTVAAMVGKTWISDSTGSATDYVKQVAAGKGLHYYGIHSGANDELLEFASGGLYFAAQEGHCAVEVLIQLSSITVPAFTFGFNDTVEDGNLPIDFSGTGLTKTADEFCGFVFDGTDATYKDVHCVWVDDGSIAQADSTGSVNGQTIRMLGMAPTASKWFYMKVELQDRGSGNGARATFLAVDHNGRSLEKTFNTTVDRDATLCWHFATETRAGTAMTMYLRDCNWEQTIANM